MKTVMILFIIVSLTAADTFARQKRVTQIPNGSTFGCTTCHTGFGGPRNDFGLQIESSFLDGNGDVIWGEALAALDSDNDGKSNGEELQDPTGTWAVGQANPGDVSLVSNPGDPNSTVGVAVGTAGLPSAFSLKPNFPNPFNPSTTISFTIPQNGSVMLCIYNSLGQPIRELLSENLQPGEYNVLWDGRDDIGELMGSGLYLARLESDGVDRTIRMLLMK